MKTVWLVQRILRGEYSVKECIKRWGGGGIVCLSPCDNPDRQFVARPENLYETRELAEASVSRRVTRHKGIYHKESQ